MFFPTRQNNTVVIKIHFLSYYEIQKLTFLFFGPLVFSIGSECCVIFYFNFFILHFIMISQVSISLQICLLCGVFLFILLARNSPSIIYYYFWRICFHFLIKSSFYWFLKSFIIPSKMFLSSQP